MSNRLTFSLASLVLILALGLVFAPVSVMAHQGDTGNLDHMHPLTEARPAVDLNTDGDETDLGEAAVPIHNTHPTVASIVAKPDADDATLRTSDDDRNVILLNAAGDAALALENTNGPGIFIVRVTFTGPLATGEALIASSLSPLK